MENSLESFNNALVDIRKAHRLIFSYQQKMLDLVKFIKGKLDFHHYSGQKHFSNPIRAKRNHSHDLYPNMWAWDFLYTYIYEYHLGTIELINSQCALSIIQYSDTGFYDTSDELDALNVESFENPENSGTKLLFILESISKRSQYFKWNISDLVNDKTYASIHHQKDVLVEKGRIQILYSFPLDNFLNEKTTMKALEEFIHYCKSQSIPLEIV